MLILLPVKAEMNVRDKREKNNIPEITDLLRYWPMSESFGGKAFEVDYINCENPQ